MSDRSDTVYIVVARFPGLRPDVQVWREGLFDSKRRAEEEWNAHVFRFRPDDRPTLIHVQPITVTDEGDFNSFGISLREGENNDG